MFELLQWATNNIFSLALAVIGFGLLIGVHECGHFLMCKLFGIHTPSFSIGFGPHLFSRTFGATTFTLRAIPLGGYVEIAGLAEPGQGDQEEAHRDDQHSFTTKPYYQKLLVALGGIICNILFSFIVFTSILYIGAPKTNLLYPYNATNTIANVVRQDGDDIPLTERDTITSINDKPITSGQDLIRTIRDLSEQEAETAFITYQRDGAQYTTQLKWDNIHNIQLELSELQSSSLWSAITTSCLLVYRATIQIYYALYYIIAHKQPQHLGGPLMIIAASMKGAQHGFSIFLLFLSFLSINLAALNILPIPVLDGGHIVFLTIEQIIGRPIPTHIRNYIDYIFAILLILLICMTSIFDTWSLIFKQG